MQLSTVAVESSLRLGEYRCIGSYAFDGKDGKLPSRAYYYESWPHDSPHVDYALLHVHYAAQPDVGDGGEPTHVNLRKCWRVDRATIDKIRDGLVTDYPPPAGMAQNADRQEWQKWIDKFKGGGAAAEAHYQAYLNNWSGDPSVNPTMQYFCPPAGFGSLPEGCGLWMEAAGGGYPLTGGYGSSKFTMQPWAFSADPVPSFAWDTEKMVVMENNGKGLQVEARYDDGRIEKALDSYGNLRLGYPHAFGADSLLVSAGSTKKLQAAEKKRKCELFKAALQLQSDVVLTSMSDVVVCFRDVESAADVEYRCCVRAHWGDAPAKKTQPIVTEQQLARVLREDRTPEKVQLKCSLTGPPTVPHGAETFELKVWLLAATAELLYILERQLAIEKKQELAPGFAVVAANEATFRVDVTVEGCEVEPPCRLVKWTDQTLCHSAFDVAVPADFSESAFQCRVLVRRVGIRIEMTKTLLRSPPGTASPTSVVTTPSELASAVAAIVRLELAEERAQMMEMLARIDANVNVIKELSFENKQELLRTCDVLLKGVFEASGVQVPTTFVVLLEQLLEKELPNPFVPIAEEAARVGRNYRRTLDMISVKWLRRLKRIGSDLAAGAVGEREAFETIKKGLGDLVTGKTMYLYLIDELTGEPVRDPTGHYPIEIKTPSDVVPKLLPVMQVGLRAMSIYNGAAGLARMFGFPIPTVPAAWATGARESVELLKHKSSVDDYGVVQAVLDQTGPKKESESVRGASLRELQRFFEKHDAQKGFAGLRRIADEDGTAVWTALTDPSAIKAAIEARAKERLAEERRAAGGPDS